MLEYVASTFEYSILLIRALYVLNISRNHFIFKWIEEKEKKKLDKILAIFLFH